jgi:hypothetical protein
VRRHSIDPVALLAGALFISVGAAYLGGVLSDTEIEARWVLPTVLIVLGLAGLMVSLANLARQRRRTELTGEPGPEEPIATDTRLADSPTAESDRGTTGEAEEGR